MALRPGPSAFEAETTELLAHNASLRAFAQAWLLDNEVVDIKVLAEVDGGLAREVAQLPGIDEAVPILVEEAERLQDLVFGIAIQNLMRHHLVGRQKNTSKKETYNGKQTKNDNLKIKAAKNTKGKT